MNAKPRFPSQLTVGDPDHLTTYELVPDQVLIQVALRAE